jgi:hypothetical protein
MAGRKTKLTEEVLNRLIEGIRAGNYIYTSCAYAGIHKDTYYEWLEKAKLPDASPLLKRLSDEVEKARAEAEMRNVLNIQRAASGGTWQASAWWLERSFPDRWGRKTEISGPNQGPIQLEVTRDELTERITAILGVEAGDGS